MPFSSFNDLLEIFYLIFDKEKFLNEELLFLFCISCGYIPLYHFSVILLKGMGIEPFVDTNVYVAIFTALLILICSLKISEQFFICLYLVQAFIRDTYLHNKNAKILLCYQ